MATEVEGGAVVFVGDTETAVDKILVDKRFDELLVTVAI